MKVGRVLPAIVVASLLMAQEALRPAKAQDAPLPEVTVTAPRPPTAEELAGDAVTKFVHLHAAPAVVSGQLARWGGGLGRVEGICPKTIGLAPRYSDFISARILAVAASVGAPVQTGRCSRHNVYVIFTTEPGKVLADMAKQDPRLLGFHSRHKTKELERIDRPIQGWYLTSSRGAHGDETVDEPSPVLPLFDPLNELAQGKHPAGLPGSRLGSGISSAIVNVLIVADTNKIGSRPIGAIADYVAVMTLTQAYASEQCGTLPSIMDMLVPNCAHGEDLTGVTAGDLAFLRALYKADVEAILSLERSSIETSMMREFERH